MYGRRDLGNGKLRTRAEVEENFKASIDSGECVTLSEEASVK